MLTVQKNECDVEGLVDHLKNAVAPTPDLIHRIIRDACTCFPALRNAGKADNVDRLIEAGAWCDVALALIDIELPAWSVRRLVREDGEWFCSLTRQPNVPVDLDDTAELQPPGITAGNFRDAPRGAPKDQCCTRGPCADRTAS